MEWFAGGDGDCLDGGMDGLQVIFVYMPFLCRVLCMKCLTPFLK